MSGARRPGGLVEGDAHDALLERRVGASAWTPPEPRDRYDLVVVGGGTAGLVSAHGAAALGARVALVEREYLGGDCLVTGCVPSKGLLRAARAMADVRDAAALGVQASIPSADFGSAMDRMRRLRADIAVNDSAERLASAGVHVFFGSARFVDERSVDVNGATLRFSRAILATGARPALGNLPGLDMSAVHTSESIFSLTTLPPKLIVLGGGPIGCELAQAFARFGSSVTLVHRGARLMPKDDADAAALVLSALERDGVRVLLGASIADVDTRGSEVLVAIGREPRVEGMDLARAGIAASKDGIVVDDFLRTSNRRVFAAGDCASRFRFTHAADALARVAVQNALFPLRRRASSLVIPWCTFTDPEVAHVGLTAEEAAARVDVATFTVPLGDVDRAILDGETEGFVRVHAERRSGRLLGATIVARHAGESIAEVVLAMTSGLSLGSIAASIHCYPTQGDALRRAAGQWQRQRLKPWMPRLLGKWLRWRG